MTTANRNFWKAPLILALILGASTASNAQEKVEHHTVGSRHAAEIMSKPPYVDIEGVARAWVVEKSADFGVVLFEVRGSIPLHTHPDGNRRMFVIEGELDMLGGSHVIRMKPGDYMYLPRSHHHKVRLAPGSKRAVFIAVDNPPTSSRKVAWIDPAPPIKYDQAQLEQVFTAAASCNK